MQVVSMDIWVALVGRIAENVFHQSEVCWYLFAWLDGKMLILKMDVWSDDKRVGWMNDGSVVQWG